MASFVVDNNVESTVADNPLAQAATTLNVAVGEGANFPSTFPFRLTIWDEDTYPDPGDDSGMEIVECTARSTDALTIARGKEGTGDVAHANGETVALLITAGLFNDATYGITTKLDGIATSADVTGSNPPQAHGASVHTDRTREILLSTPHYTSGTADSWGINLGPDAQQLIYYTTILPKDFVSLNNIYLIFRPSVGGNAVVASIQGYYGAIGASHLEHSDADDTNIINTPANVLMKYQTSLTLPNIVQTDILTFKIIREGTDGNDTNTGNMEVKGILLEYTADM